MYRASNPSLSHAKQFHFQWVSRVRSQRYIWISMRQYSMTDNWQLCELDKVHKTISCLNCLFKLQSKCFQSRKQCDDTTAEFFAKSAWLASISCKIQEIDFFLLSLLNLTQDIDLGHCEHNSKYQAKMNETQNQVYSRLCMTFTNCNTLSQNIGF